MIRAALYARYSSDKQREASITDQFRNAARRAEEEDWEIARHYSDEAISGSISERPGYQAMLTDAKAGCFNVIVVDDLSRLSRDDVELKLAIKRLQFWEVRLVSVSDGYDSDSKGAKIHAGMRGIFNEIFLDDLREKTLRGLTGQALKGYNTGGRCYGYRHIPILDESRRDEYDRPEIIAVKREIDEEQACVVRQIFQWFADGHSPRWISAELNRRGVKPLRSKAWSGTTIRGDCKTGMGLLANELYIGCYRFNRFRYVTNPETGKRKRFANPEDDWITKDMPDLRIVPQELWDRVRERQLEQLAASDAIRLSQHDRARPGRGPKYLFSGILRCGCCGGKYAIVDYRYGCATHVNGGPAACSNKLRVRRDLVEELLLDAIKRDLFSPECIELFKRETVRLLTEYKRRQRPDTAKLQKRLAEVDAEIDNIIAAIKEGAIFASLQDALQQAEAERTDLQATLRIDTRGIDQVASILPRAVDRYRELVSNLAEVAVRDMVLARTQIKALVGGEIRLFPTDGGYLEAEIAGDYAGLIRLIKDNPGTRGAGAKLSVVAGEGLEPPTKRL